MQNSEIDTLLQRLAARPQPRRPLHLVGTKRFDLVRKLGSGGFGDVYEARDRHHGTRVALKALRSADPEWVYRFKREFRVAADLAHPNIVRLYELLVEDDRWFLTMELLDGMHLREYLTRAPERLRTSFGQLALGLAELHRASCLHRDLKPSNVIVEPSGRVVLVDFGLAVNQRATRMSAVAGTPPYMAPELGLGQPASARSDWYAFGVMLYEALAGRLPFDGDEIEMLRRKLGPPPPAPLGADPDPGLAALALRLLEKDPAARATATDVFAELVGPVIVPSRRATVRVVGRTAELATLEGALEAARSGAILATVRGPAGMGKSSLLGAFEDRLRGRGVAMYLGRCREVESVPFKGLDPVIDLVCGDLARRRDDTARRIVPRDVGALTRMFPMFKRVEAFVRASGDELTVGSPQQMRDAATRALKELLTRLSADAPIVIAIDDLQWAGDDTLSLLAELVRAPAPHCLFVFAHRDEHAPSIEALGAVVAKAAAHHVEVEVGPLDGRAIAEWIGSGATTMSADAALRESGGHPYLLSRLIEVGDEDVRPGRELVTVLSREISRLDPAAREALEVIAAAGGPIRATLALEVTGRMPELATLDHLRRRKLIRGVDAYVEPYHDRVREVVVAEATPERRRAVHLGLAVALERAALVAPDELAQHYLAGGDTARAFTWTLRAAELASSTFAFAHAIALYQRALEIAPDDAQRLDVLGHLADALVHAGQLVASSEVCLQASALARALHRDEVAASYRATAGERALIAGRQARGFELLREALAEVDVRLPESAAVAVAESFNIGGALAAYGLDRRTTAAPDPRLLRRLDLELAVARALTQTDLRAPLMAARSLDDALTAGEPRRLQLALSLFVFNHAARMPGHPLMHDAESRARALALELADEVAMAWAELAGGIHAMYLQDFPTALADLASAERRFKATPGYVREAELGRMGAIVVCGNYYVDLPHARARAAGYLEDALARGDIYTAMWARFVQIHLRLASGHPAEARALLDGIYATWPVDRDSMLAANLVNHRIGIALFEDPSTAWREVEATAESYAQLFSAMIPISVQLYGRLTANSAVGAWLAGAADRDTTLARVERSVAQLSKLPLAGGHMVVEALRCFVRGDKAGERAARRRSSELYAASNQRLLASTCRYRALQAEGDPTAAEVAAELRALGCADPDRFATFIAGPLAPG